MRGEALRYLVASVLALLLDTGSLWALTHAVGSILPVWVTGAIAYAAGLLLIYVLSVHWVFGARTVKNTHGEFMAFAMLGIIGLALNSATLQLATSAGFALVFAKIVSAGIGFVANFVSRKLLLFSKRQLPR